MLFEMFFVVCRTEKEKLEELLTSVSVKAEDNKKPTDDCHGGGSEQGPGDEH